MSKRKWYPYIMLMPLALMLIIFMIYPIIDGLVISLYKWNGVNERTFIGFENYSNVFKDPVFYSSLKNTLIYGLVSMAGTVGLGLVLALLIVNRKAINAYRVIFYIPVLLSGTAVALIWSKIYEPNFGILNSLLNAVGLDSLANAWLGEPNTALGASLVVAIWKYCGFPMLLILTAIMSIPTEIYESAKIDGSNRFSEIFYITLPLIKNVLFTCIMLQMINAMKAFDIIWAMTKGGPGSSTKVLTLHIYEQAFAMNKFGYGAALAVILLVVIISISGVYNLIISRFRD